MIKSLIPVFCFLCVVSGHLSHAQTNLPTSSTTSPATPTKAEQEILTLSKDKWQWMSDKSVIRLDSLFDEKAMFVHMGGSWGKTQELNIIRMGGIWYKKADVYSASVNIIGNTAILLNDIDLVAVVGGNEVGRRSGGQSVYGDGGICQPKWQMENGVALVFKADAARQNEIIRIHPVGNALVHPPFSPNFGQRRTDRCDELVAKNQPLANDTELIRFSG